MGKAELFRQTEDHVPDSVLLDWIDDCVVNISRGREEFAIRYYIYPDRQPKIKCGIRDDIKRSIKLGLVERETPKNAMGVG